METLPVELLCLFYKYLDVNSAIRLSHVNSLLKTCLPAKILHKIRFARTLYEIGRIKYEIGTVYWQISSATESRVKNYSIRIHAGYTTNRYVVNVYIDPKLYAPYIYNYNERVIIYTTDPSKKHTTTHRDAYFCKRVLGDHGFEDYNVQHCIFKEYNIIQFNNFVGDIDNIHTKMVVRAPRNRNSFC